MTMLATKDSEHICELDAYRIAKKCNFRLPDGTVNELLVLDCLKVLASPDKRRTVKQEHEGRRIKAVDGGWFIINGQKYKEWVQKEMRKASWRKAQAKKRAKQAELVRSQPLPGEQEYVDAEKRGDAAGADAVLNRHLPEGAKA